jgi:hypothetical protein
MPGLVPGIHVFYRPCDQDVDGRDSRVKTRFALLPGHDAGIFVMHDIKSIRENPTAFDQALGRRGLPPKAVELMGIDERRRHLILASEQAQARRNSASKEIGEAKKAKDDARAAKLMAELKTTMPELEAAAKASDEELAKELAAIPNLPLDEVPDGIDEHGNVQRHVFGAVRNYAFTPKPHFDLGEAMGFMDFEAAAKLSGARFVVLKKGLARLERAIGQFMLDLHTNEHSYAEINPERVNCRNSRKINFTHHGCFLKKSIMSVSKQRKLARVNIPSLCKNSWCRIAICIGSSRPPKSR